MLVTLWTDVWIKLTARTSCCRDVFLTSESYITVNHSKTLQPSTKCVANGCLSAPDFVTAQGQALCDGHRSWPELQSCQQLAVYLHSFRKGR